MTRIFAFCRSLTDSFCCGTLSIEASRRNLLCGFIPYEAAMSWVMFSICVKRVHKQSILDRHNADDAITASISAVM